MVVVLWNPSKVAESLKANPRQLVVEDGARSRTPGTTVSKYSQIDCTVGLPPRAMHKQELIEWTNTIQGTRQDDSTVQRQAAEQYQTAEQ